MKLVNNLEFRSTLLYRIFLEEVDAWESNDYFLLLSSGTISKISRLIFVLLADVQVNFYFSDTCSHELYNSSSLYCSG